MNPSYGLHSRTLSVKIVLILKKIINAIFIRKNVLFLEFIMRFGYK